VRFLSRVVLVALLGLGFATLEGCAGPAQAKKKPSCPQKRAVNKHRW
jgi:hypothetical protein